MTDLTTPPPGHCESAIAWAQFYPRYVGVAREDGGGGPESDFALANAQYMLTTTELGGIGVQTAAKERMRWLSVQLAAANERLAELEKPVRILVKVDGGVVNEIISDRDLPNVRVVVVDEDIEDTADEDIIDVRAWDYDGETAVIRFAANVTVHEVTRHEGLDWEDGFRNADTDELVDIFDETDDRVAKALLQIAALESVWAQPVEVLYERAWDTRPAEREGWGLFMSDTYGLEIEADHDSEQFMVDFHYDDAAAVEFVRAKADAGSLYHRLAVHIHDRGRAALRADAEKAGYTVFQIAVDSGDGAFGFTRPAGHDDAPGGPFRSEEAAWTAAFRDALDKNLLEEEA